MASRLNFNIEKIINRYASDSKNTTKAAAHGIVGIEVKNHGKNAFVVKKVEKARKTILRVGFPNIEKK